MAQVSEHLSELYADYYGDATLAKKRTLAARDSVAHLEKLRGKEPVQRLLEVGAGNGSVLSRIVQHGLAYELSALEISASGIEQIKNRPLNGLKDVVAFDGYTIPFPDKSFDLALCIHVMEHVEHERILLREMARVAREVFIEVPLEGGFRGRTNYQYGHINYYTPLSFRALVETSGLKIKSAEVFTSSAEYGKHCSGTAKGTINNAIRRTLLRAVGPRASELMTYLMAVHCESV